MLWILTHLSWLEFQTQYRGYDPSSILSAFSECSFSCQYLMLRLSVPLLQLKLLSSGSQPQELVDSIPAVDVL